MADEFKVASEAVADAKRIGLGGDIPLRLARMAKRAAPLTSMRGNRRFGDYALTIKNGVVLAVCKP